VARYTPRYPAGVPAAPTAPLAAGSLIGGYAVAAASGSRPLGGLVLAAGGLGCLELWRRRRGARTALGLGAAGLSAFAFSHVLARVIGAWPSVLTVSAAMAVLAWVFADAREGERRAVAHRG
jgi:CHASE2 domain-containing sensor protein